MSQGGHLAGNALRVVTDAEVATALDWDRCIAAVEAAFRSHGAGRAGPIGVLGLAVPGGGFHLKAGVLAGERSYFAAKVNANFPDNPERYGLPTIQGLVVLCDATTGTPLAVMSANELTRRRTAAATAIAARWLARPDASVATIVGCGVQGLAQLEALHRVRPLRRVFACDARMERAQVLAAEVTAISASTAPWCSACAR